MLYRSLVVGLLAACFILIARSRVRVVHVHDAAPPPPAAVARAQPPVVIRTPPIVIHDHAPPVDAAATLIDVSSAVPNSQLMSLVRLAPTEHVAGYEDHHNYIDIQVRGEHGDRRVLVLKR
jgi:hypothetical protein